MKVKHNFLNSDSDDSALLDLLQKGSSVAFTFIYNRYHKMLYVIAFRYLKDRTMAEDAVQQIFTRLWDAHQDLIISVSLRNYLHTMIKNYILNQMRNDNTAMIKNYQVYQQTSGVEDDLIDKIEKKELLSLLYKGIELLPDQKKIICKLKLEGKFSNQEIADKMEISINTVKSHYLQSVNILREYLKKMLQTIIIILTTPFI